MARKQDDSAIVENPQFDENGFLVWDPALEAAFQREQNLKGQAAVALKVGDSGYATAILIGCVLQGHPRRWVVRVGVLPTETEKIRYSITYQYVGETYQNAMYPRLPLEERVTGELGDISLINGPIQAYFDVIDRASEEAYLEASAGARASLKAIINDLQPRPWWRFW